MIRTRDIEDLLDILNIDAADGLCVACQFLRNLDCDGIDTKYLRQSFGTGDRSISEETLKLPRKLQFLMLKNKVRCS